MDTFTVAEGVGKMIIKSQMDFFAANKPDDLAHVEANRMPGQPPGLSREQARFRKA